MNDGPRRSSARRSRAPQPSFPLLPLLLGVILAGFGIGAGFAYLQRNATGAPAAATPLPSVPPSAIPSPAPPGSPAPTDSPSPSPTPSASPSPSPSPSPSVTPSASPSASAAASSATSPVASDAPAASALPAASAPPSAAPSDDADSDFARLSTVVVRQYIAALVRGDDVAAYGAFGAAPGAPDVTLSEKRFVDRSTRIVRVSASGTDSDATVDVDFTTKGVEYFAQYALIRTPSGAAVIHAHSILKA